jgi:putative flippase GtrA
MKLLRYAIVGAITLIVYLLTAAVMQFYGMSMILISTIPFFLAISINYAMQKSWVFKNVDYGKHSLSKYIFMTCFGYVFNVISIIIITRYTSLFLAQICSVFLVVISNAIFSFFWIFSPKKLITSDEFKSDKVINKNIL